MQRTILVLLCAALAAGAAHAAEEKYQRKSGLWELKRTSTRSGDAARTYQVCVDQASDDVLRQLAGGMRSERCETSKVVREGDKVLVDAECKGSGTSTETTHSVITGKLDSAYRIESKVAYDPPVRGQKEGSTVMEAKWTGACKPNMKAGDVILPNGTKVSSLSETPKQRPAAGKPAKQKSRYAPADAMTGTAMPPPAATTPATPPAAK
ncbi:MAG: DUF3617 domain-containing protein [Acidobacteriota bacterium]